MADYGTSVISQAAKVHTIGSNGYGETVTVTRGDAYQDANRTLYFETRHPVDAGWTVFVEIEGERFPATVPEPEAYPSVVLVQFDSADTTSFDFTAATFRIIEVQTPNADPTLEDSAIHTLYDATLIVREG
jgi:hypothetical protein